MKYALDWLSDPEVFAVNRIAAHSDHKYYRNYYEMEEKNSSFIQNHGQKIHQKELKIFIRKILILTALITSGFRDILNCRDMASRNTLIQCILGRGGRPFSLLISLKRIIRSEVM
mgnify:CR=1 FL=1